LDKWNEFRMKQTEKISKLIGDARVKKGKPRNVLKEGERITYSDKANRFEAWDPHGDLKRRPLKHDQGTRIIKKKDE